MRIALPIAEEKLSPHFGHSERFALIDVDPKGGAGMVREDVLAPPHEPGALPSWLADLGTDVVIAGGMGEHARSLLTSRGIRVVIGAPTLEPERLVSDYLAGSLAVGANTCDHP